MMADRHAAKWDTSDQIESARDAAARARDVALWATVEPWAGKAQALLCVRAALGEVGFADRRNRLLGRAFAEVTSAKGRAALLRACHDLGAFEDAPGAFGTWVDRAVDLAADHSPDNDSLSPGAAPLTPSGVDSSGSLSSRAGWERRLRNPSRAVLDSHVAEKTSTGQAVAVVCESLASSMSTSATISDRDYIPMVSAHKSRRPGLCHSLRAPMGCANAADANSQTELPTTKPMLRRLVTSKPSRSASPVVTSPDAASAVRYRSPSTVHGSRAVRYASSSHASLPQTPPTPCPPESSPKLRTFAMPFLSAGQIWPDAPTSGRRQVAVPGALSGATSGTALQFARHSPDPITVSWRQCQNGGLLT